MCVFAVKVWTAVLCLGDSWTVIISNYNHIFLFRFMLHHIMFETK